jgi:hypothetical protein
MMHVTEARPLKIESMRMEARQNYDSTTTNVDQSFFRRVKVFCFHAPLSLPLSQTYFRFLYVAALHAGIYFATAHPPGTTTSITNILDRKFAGLSFPTAKPQPSDPERPHQLTKQNPPTSPDQQHGIFNQILHKQLHQQLFARWQAHTPLQGKVFSWLSYVQEQKGQVR